MAESIRTHESPWAPVHRLRVLPVLFSRVSVLPNLDALRSNLAHIYL